MPSRPPARFSAGCPACLTPFSLGKELPVRRDPWQSELPRSSIPRLPSARVGDDMTGGFGGGFGGDEKSESLWALVDNRMRGRWKWATLIGLGLAAVLALIGLLTAVPM